MHPTLILSEKLETKATAEPVLIARNYPVDLTIPGFTTHPCISTLKGKRISMYPEFSGVTLYVDRPLSKAELKTLFLFTVHKFPLIEIMPTTYINMLLTLEILSSTQLLNIYEGKRLYLQFDCNLVKESSLVTKVLNELSKVTKTVTGIHFVNCNNNNGILLNKSSSLLQFIASSPMTLGVELEDCVEETMLDFNPVSNLEVFLKVDYLVCNDLRGKHRQEATNNDKDQLQIFLDSHLFVQKHHQRVFKNRSKTLLFRQSPDPYTDEEGESTTVENYLNYIADVSEYAKAYKLKFLMGPAFDSEDGTRFGWWKISNFDNLTNVSVIVEKESEFYRRESWRPGTHKKDNTPSSINVSSLAIIIGITVSITVLVVVVLFIIPICWYRRKFAFISKEEVEFFLKGKPKKGEKTESEDVENLKFPQEYEILDTNFLLLKVLGQGNFGVVHSAQLQLDDGENSTQIVAVKMPLPGCTKESFKSMLSELKVLCYVGNHPNVIQFIGAHVKEIGKGKVYIATEMCENGALINYLRNLNNTVSGSEGALHENGQRETIFNEDLIPQLNRFSYEIALGMEYLGIKKIIHGDLSGRNVLLDSNLSCKIGDFGLSRKLYEYEQYVKKSQEPLLWRWMALESLKMMAFTTKSDVWSYGVTLWEIYSLGAVPYPGLSWTINFVDELENGLRLTSPPKASDLIYEMMMTCWNSNPEARPTFSEIALFYQRLRDSEYVIVEEI